MPEDPGERNPAPDLLAAGASLDDLGEAVQGCTACELYQDATQAVFGEGQRKAKIMILGEQPGDEEDKAGEPFVGPAGRVLDAALEAAGIDRDEVYITNVVKHFRWKPGAKKRLHQTPTRRHVAACRPWLEAELALVEPLVIVTLGASASQAILGGDIRVTEDHGEVFEWKGILTIPTIHPSAALRALDAGDRQRLRQMLIKDLGVARRLAEGG